MENKLVKQKVFINDKEEEGYFFTEDELNEFVKDAYPTAEYWKGQDELWNDIMKTIGAYVPAFESEIKKLKSKYIIQTKNNK
jgi:hypothetical protein